jgi:hypothetical protein
MLLRRGNIRDNGRRVWPAVIAMPTLASIFAPLLSLSLVVGPPEGEPVPLQTPTATPASAPAPEPSLENPDWGAAGEPGPAPAAGPAPAPAPTPTPVDQGVVVEPPNGTGLLIAGPLTIAAGVPLAFAGNAAWRDACGPDTSDRECARGSTLSGFSHTLAGLAFTGGTVFLAVGGGRRGGYDASRHVASGMARSGRSGFIVAGAVLMPISLISLGMARLFFWLPTPECQSATCVRDYQTLATASVSGLVLLTGAGAAMFTYGLGYNRWVRRHARVALAPTAGRGFAGLSLGGRF